MKKLFPLLALALAVSCNNDATQNPVETKNTTTRPAALSPELPITAVQAVAKPKHKTHYSYIAQNSLKDSLYLSRLLSKFESKAQVFAVPATGISTITGKGGTVITVNPANLLADGKAVTGYTGTITVELKELLDTQSLLKNNAQTMCGDRLLVSGGSYYIAMNLDGCELDLAPGKTLEVQLPKIATEEMELFYGERVNGNMDWQQAAPGGLACGGGNDSYISAFCGSTLVVNTMDFDVAYDYGYAGQNATPEQVKQAEISRDLYRTMQLNRLGWINCDRFYNEPKTSIPYALEMPEGMSFVQTYVVFKDINSVMSGRYTTGQPVLHNLPVGKEVTFILVGVKNEQVYAASTDFLISENTVVKPELKPVAEGYVNQLFENL